MSTTIASVSTARENLFSTFHFVILAQSKFHVPTQYTISGFYSYPKKWLRVVLIFSKIFSPPELMLDKKNEQVIFNLVNPANSK